MITNFKQLLLFYSISFAIFWTNGSKMLLVLNCSDFEEKLSALAKTVDELQGHMDSIILEIDELFMLRENIIYGAKRKSPPNILEIKCGGSFPVSCDFKTEQAGWTVIQRRQDGSVNFNRKWTEYVHGFGDVDGEFFIGLEKLHALTTMGAEQQLYIILEDFEGHRKYAKFNTFIVASKDKDYKLTISGYSGDAGDNLWIRNGCKFYTWDRDTDTKCARNRQAGWWYCECYTSNLNGPYLMGFTAANQYQRGVVWLSFRGFRYSLRFTQMMIRPREN